MVSVVRKTLLFCKSGRFSGGGRSERFEWISNTICLCTEKARTIRGAFYCWLLFRGKICNLLYLSGALYLIFHCISILRFCLQRKNNKKGQMLTGEHTNCMNNEFARKQLKLITLLKTENCSERKSRTSLIFFFRLSFHNCKSCVYNRDDLLSI